MEPLVYLKERKAIGNDRTFQSLHIAPPPVVRDRGTASRAERGRKPWTKIRQCHMACIAGQGRRDNDGQAGGAKGYKMHGGIGMTDAFDNGGKNFYMKRAASAPNGWGTAITRPSCQAQRF